MTETRSKAIAHEEGTDTTASPDSTETLPVGLRRPASVGLTRMLAGRPMDEEIIDPANPNLMRDRDGG
ncbi:MAG: hypothetical protein HQL98_09830 [Magnetococcales bacterium]|nr:hypothetical protein [Magnetococcales bacterium]